MKKMHLLALAQSIWLIWSGPVPAATLPTPGTLDPRIQTIPYNPDEVALLRGTLGYQFMLEFDPAEKIETVSIGDALAWQVTPNRKSNVLFLKPISRSTTNLTVLTNLRRYAFELQVALETPEMPILYIARMVYPQPAQLAAAAPPVSDPPPTVANSSYTMTGSKLERPTRIFDDGRMTYFEWPPTDALPAIFVVSDDGSESLVNYFIRGPYVVVDQIARAFILRDGKETIKVQNGGAAP